MFEDKLSEVEAAAWVAFTEVCENFLGNNKSSNYEHIVNHLIDAYSDMGATCPLKFTIFIPTWTSFRTTWVL